MDDLVILVDENDRETGTAGKMEAHRKGLLHRAVSVFICNNKSELLIQQRAAVKYHSPRQWANTCCTHPFPGETPLTAASRRLGQEMGLMVPLRFGFTHLYKADVGNGLWEHELDHVFFGLSNVEPIPHPGEVMDWKFITPEKTAEELKNSPTQFAPWFQELFPPALNWIKSNF